ncbi:MAG: pyrimidine-nucleoside phosphorylase, partial [Anaerolineae bacterium]|nr:pyrimidine-nucleoside phosphorylase [Anaerolineae bacterium]
VEKAKKSLADGSAFARFRQMVQAQGGDVNQIDHPEKLPQASLHETMTAPREGYIQSVDALAVGYGVVDLGGGRMTKSDPVDYAVGILTHVKVGQKVKSGDVLFTLLANVPQKLAAAKETLKDAVEIGESPVEPLPLFYDTLEGV